MSFECGWSMLGVGASCVQGRFGLRMFSLKVAVKVSGSNALSALLGQCDFFCLCVCVCVLLSFFTGEWAVWWRVFASGSAFRGPALHSILAPQRL